MRCVVYWVKQWTNLLFTNAVSFSMPKEMLRINLDFINSNMFFMNFLSQMAAADLFFNIDHLFFKI